MNKVLKNEPYVKFSNRKMLEKKNNKIYLLI